MKKKEIQYDANGKRVFGIRDSIAYAAGDLGCNMSFALKSTMAIFWQAGTLSGQKMVLTATEIPGTHIPENGILKKTVCPLIRLRLTLLQSRS